MKIAIPQSGIVKANIRKTVRGLDRQVKSFYDGKVIFDTDRLSAGPLSYL